MSLTRKAAVLASAVITLMMGLAALGWISPRPLEISDSPLPETRIRISAAHDRVWLPGQCIAITWETSGVDRVFLRTDAQPTTGSADVCVERGAQLALTAGLADGQQVQVDLPLRIMITHPIFWALLSGFTGFVVLTIGIVGASRIKPRLLLSSYLAFNALILVFVLVNHLTDISGAEVVDLYNGSTVIYRADRHRVLLPDDCVNVSWSVTDVQSTTFYPVLERGILNGAGTRSIFAIPHWNNIPRVIVDDAPGGQTWAYDVPTGTAQTGSGQSCIDFMTEPKIRVRYSEEASVSYHLNIDVAFLMLDTWLLMGAAGVLVGLAILIAFPALTYRFIRLTLWASTLVLLFYGWVLMEAPALFSVYFLDAPILFALIAVSLLLTAMSLFRPARFDAWTRRTLDRINAAPKPIIGVGIIAFWLWVLAFGYFTENITTNISEFLFLPLFFWALIVGLCLLGYIHRHDAPATYPPAASRKVLLGIALIFAVLAIVRDVIMVGNFGLMFTNDSRSYITESRDLFNDEASTGLPKRIFPYVLISNLTNITDTPLFTVGFQIIIGATAIASLVYVLARRKLWMGIGVGVLLLFELSWSTFNRAILTEGTYISFHVISLAMLIDILERKRTVKIAYLFLFGILIGWTMLYRGTGLPLIPLILLLVLYSVRSVKKTLAFAAGVVIFIGSVGVFNLWRYEEFGLIGPQHDTVVSALTSYHLFSPDNGSASREIDRELRDCIPYLDYDDVPRYLSLFIYNYFNRCLLDQYTRQPLTDLTNKAFRELIFGRPLEFMRSMIQEYGKGFKISPMSNIKGYSRSETNLRQCRETVNWCDTHIKSPDITGSQHRQMINIMTALAFTGQAQLGAQVVTSNSDAVMLFAFLMVSGFLFVARRDPLLVLICSLFLIYQVATVAAVHVFLIRYTAVFTPFYFIIALLMFEALWTIIRQLTRHIRFGLRLVMMVLGMGVYLLFANPLLRTSITLPVSAQIAPQTNLFVKYGISDTEYAIYSSDGKILRQGLPSAEFAALETRTHTPETLSSEEQSQYTAWRQLYLPGYLKSIGVRWVSISFMQWELLSDEQRALFDNPEYYRRVVDPTKISPDVHLFEVIGETRGIYQMHNSTQIAVFEQPDRQIDIYRLDAAGQGTFAARFDPQAVVDRLEISTDTGEIVRFETVGSGEYRLLLLESDGQTLIDDTFILKVSE